MALIPALIKLAMSGRGGGGGGGGGYGGGYGGGGRGRQPFDPQADLDKKAGQYFHGGGRNPFATNTNYTTADQGAWDRIFSALAGETPMPEPQIDLDIHDPLDEE